MGRIKTTKNPDVKQSLGKDQTHTALVRVGKSCLSAGDVPVLQEALETAVRGTSGTIILELGAVRRINSAILALLVLEEQEARGYGKRLVLVGIHGGAMDMLALYRMDTTFQIYSSVEEAMGYSEPKIRRGNNLEIKARPEAVNLRMAG